MEELIKLVAKKTGLPEATAKQAVEVGLGFLKERLPAPIAGQIDGLLSNPNLGKQAGDLLKGAGGLFGR